VPNAPTAVVSHFNDRIAGSNYNYITTQVGVSTPVWLPGEGTATQNAAQAERVAIEAQAAMAHLVLAADVLRLATSATDAANTRAIAARRLATSRALAGDLSRQFAVGEAAQSDALAAEADAANAAVTLAGGVAVGRGQGGAGGGDGVAGDPGAHRVGGNGSGAGGRASAAPRGDGAGAGGAGAAAAGVSAGS